MLRIFDMGGVVTNTAELALVEKISGRKGLSLKTFITKDTCFLAIIAGRYGVSP